MNHTGNTHDTRWLCWSCGDLDRLNDDGLCRRCKPEAVGEFYQICMRVVAGEKKETRQVWVIG